MTVERFTKDQFENALTDHGFTWSALGIDYGEECYSVDISPHARVVVRSSIGEKGVSADAGEDSIRLWLNAHREDDMWVVTSRKVDAYTQRTPGWENRMSEKIHILAERGSRIERDVPLCPTCSKPMFIYWVRKLGKNTGRPFAKCIAHNHFTWLDETAKVVASKNEPILPVVKASDDKVVVNKDDVVANDDKDDGNKGGAYFIKDATPAPVQEPVMTPRIEVASDREPNPEQKEAIYAPVSSAVRVLAPPGSGKTFVAEMRVKYLLENGVEPNDILYVTFSADMAKDGLARMLQANPELAGSEAVNQFCTIHAICYRMLRWEGDKRRVPKEWQIKKAITEITERLWDDPDNRPGYKEVYLWINETKMEMMTQAQYQEFYYEALGNYHGHRLYKARSKFDLEMRRQNMITFPDMLHDVEEKLEGDHRFTEKYQAKFKYVIVDEGQDTSGQAMRILTTLAKPQNQFMIVGDSDQLLYRFAGATPEENLFQGFEERYPDGLLVKLITNYRSTKNVIDATRVVIKNNYADAGGVYEQKYYKPIAPRENAPDGDTITFTEYETIEEESQALADEINQRLEESADPGSFFVGARTRAQLGYIEGPLVRHGIPFINAAGGSFWDLKHVNDVVSYVRLAHDEDDKDAFKRVYNIASKWMTVPWKNSDDYGQYCSHRFLGRAFLDASYGSLKYVAGASRKRSTFAPGVEDLTMFINDLKIELQEKGIANAIQYVIDNCYLAHLKANEGIVVSDEAENGKLSDLQTVIELSLEFGNDANGFFEHVKEAQKASQDKKDKNWGDYVVISTIHRLKGLERDYVYGVGMSEGVQNAGGVETPCGLLPHTFSLVPPPQNGVLPSGGMGRVEDERCVFYVLISRAKEEVHLSGIKRYRKMVMHPSRFVAEIGL